jgi:hypothetical protein
VYTNGIAHADAAVSGPRDAAAAMRSVQAES